jgi:hypothetical protein
MNRQLKPLAIKIAEGLLADLKSGKLKTVGIDQIREACAKEKDHDQEILIETTTRCLIERV